MQVLTRRVILLGLLLAGLLCAWQPVMAAEARIDGTARGAVAETDRFQVEFRDGVLVSLVNKLTHEQYLDPDADLAAVVPHLPSGLGTQNGEAAMTTAEKLYHWPWWEHPNNMALPNQHYADAKSQCTFTRRGEAGVLSYRGLTDGQQRYEDETFLLTLEIDPATGDLLVTPEGQSPRPGVYAANLTLAPMASAVTAEAPICDGIRISRENTGPVLWTNQWPDYWDYGFLALNGWKRGAVGIWTQDQRCRFYKNLFYLNNGEGLSFSFSMMNIPPFEELKSCRSPLPWRLQAFDKSWMQAVERYHAWREANVKMAPRPDFAQHISFIASIAGPQQNWMEKFLRYTQPWQGHATAFLACVRKQPFDHNHADNTPVDTFKDDTKRWRESGTYGMAYLQPMIMWGPFPPEAQQSEREKQGRAFHKLADTHLVFEKDPNTVVPYVDQHHLGEPKWQRWFLDWVHEWCKDYGAQGIYHDQSYHAPIDRRGLAINGMTSPEGMADYFYKAATENPGTFHGTEKVTEANAVGVSNAIGSGYHWGTAPFMRMTRANNSSPVTAALASPYTVLWSFVRLRGESVYDLRERRMQEMRAQIAGAIDGPLEVDPKYFPMLCNVPWHDRTRDETFLKYGLRPYFPADYDRQVESYFRGEQGEEFRYEKTAWGSRFVQVQKDGTKTMIYGIASGAQAAAVDGGIAGWVVYNTANPDHTWNVTGPSGLNPDRYYVVDPTIKRPPVYFSTTQGYGPSLYESYVADSGYNEYFAFLKLRTIERLTQVTSWEQLVLHSPTPPKAIYVNGKKIDVTRQGDTDAYAFSAAAPADICVILKDPPADAVNLSQAALLRVTEPGTPVDYYRPETLQAMAKGGVTPQGLPILQDSTVPGLGFNFGSRKHLYVPLAVPAGSTGGRWRIQLPAKDNAQVESVDVNLVRFAAAEGAIKLPETLEIPLAPGEVKLLALHTKAITESYACTKVTTRITLEWVEGK